MLPPPRFNVLGTGVHALTLDQARDFLLSRRGATAAACVFATTVHGVSEALHDAELREAYGRAALITPDGMPLVWLARWHGHRHTTRVYGPDLMLAVCDQGRAVGLRHYFYGGAPGVADKLAAALTQRFPGLEVAGKFTPPYRALTAEEFAAFQDDVATKRPDVIWIGLGTPKQEKFATAAAPHLAACALVTVGAAFDFHTGRVRQAPRWMMRCGLEWLFRLVMEPRRLWRRYLILNPLFVLRTLAQITGIRSYGSK